MSDGLDLFLSGSVGAGGVAGLVGLVKFFGERLTKGKDDLEAKAAAQEAASRAEAARVDAEWRAEVRLDLKRLLDNSANTATQIAVMDKRIDAVEVRQREQAAAHLAAVEKSSTLHLAALERLEKRTRGR